MSFKFKGEGPLPGEVWIFGTGPSPFIARMKRRIDEDTDNSVYVQLDMNKKE